MADTKPRRTILSLHNSKPRPVPRFESGEGSSVPVFLNGRMRTSSKDKSTSTSTYASRMSSSRTYDPTAYTARSLPAIQAQLRRQYSEEQLRKVPPLFLPCLGKRSACLAEPYEVTLRKASKASGGRVGVIHSPHHRTSKIDTVLGGSKGDVPPSKRSPQQVTFGGVKKVS